tara:strand:- start:748 stop:1218 length:471 start_codon:yes stop_codon:yes gene_type:complete
MSSIVLTGDTSGTITVSAPAVAGTRTLTLPAATGTAILEDASGVLQMNSGYGSLTDAYGCRAWVNFNGTGTVAIRASGNVSSITDNGSGDYTVNFTTAMPDVNYAANASTANTNRIMLITTNSYVVGSVKVQINYVNFAGGNTPALDSSCSVAVFR